MDTLTRVLHILRLEPKTLHHLRLSVPWGFRLSIEQGAGFHIVEKGSAWLRIAHGGHETPVELQQGDLVVVSNTAAYELVDTPAGRAVPLDALLRRRTPDGRLSLATPTATETKLMCSTFQAEKGVTSPLFAVMPSLIYIPGTLGRPVEWLAAPLKMIAYEIEHDYPGREAVVSRVMDILFIMVIRYWIGSYSPQNGGWLHALYHPQLGAALALIHRQPAAPWTVESLAAALHMSRSSLANQFTAVVGESPMKYLRRWRIQLASLWLRDEPAATLESIAQRVGYSSAYAFSKAFKQVVGLSPAAYRQLPPKN